jgi:MFS family permease
MMVSSIFLSIFPENYIVVIIARSVFGVGFGSTYLTSIMYGSEIASPKVRAQLLFLIYVFTVLGMFLFGLFIMSRSITAILQLSGAISAALSFLSAAVAYFKLKSSHIYLMQNNSNDALERFQYFQQDSTDNPHVESETLQSLIIEEKKRRYNLHGRHNVSALLAICLVKIGYLSISNALHSFYRLILLGTRLCGCIVGFLLLDRITKRLQYFIPTITISIGLLIFWILLMIYNFLYIWTPLIFFIPLEFFLGIGLSPIADILKGELFPLKEKPVSIAIAIAFGEILHIVCLAVLYSWIFSLGSIPRTLPLIFGAITLVCGVGVAIVLKDSRKQSLRLVANLYADK